MRQLLAAALLLCRHDAATALRLPSALKQQHTRSDFLKLAAVTAGTAAWSTCRPAWSLDLDDDEDLNDNDEIPDVRMRQPAKSKAKPVADAAAGKAAYAQLVAARRALDDFSTDNLAPYEGLEQVAPFVPLFTRHTCHSTSPVARPHMIHPPQPTARPRRCSCSSTRRCSGRRTSWR